MQWFIPLSASVLFLLPCYLYTVLSTYLFYLRPLPRIYSHEVLHVSRCRHLTLSANLFGDSGRGKAYYQAGETVPTGEEGTSISSRSYF